MDKTLFLDFNPHEEISDALSTSAASLTHLPCDDGSPTNPLSVNSIDNELGHGSKKIRKKRNAYHKIDDDIRLKLLEAVQRGETLKSAAKRYQVNYSSAKSIFHIFRKEGRILKKANNEKGFGFDFPCAMPNPEFQQQQQQQFFGHQAVMQNRYNPQFQRTAPGFPQGGQIFEHKQDRMFHGYEDCSGSSSPLNNLVDNFSGLLRIGDNPQKTREEMLRKQQIHQSIHPSRFNPSNSPTHAMLRTQQNPQPSQFGQTNQLSQFSQMSQMNQLNQLSMQRNQLTNQLNQINQMAQITLASKPNNAASMASPSERLKQFDNFYMNYSNSPLSGNSRMVREGSESGSNRNLQREFESFSDMVTAFQSSNHLTESLKKNETANIPKLIQTPTKQQLQEKSELKLPLEEDPAWSGTIETAALDTFKSFMDAQMVLSNAFKKASLLNNLVQIQKSKVDGSPSPRFISFQGN